MGSCMSFGNNTQMSEPNQALSGAVEQEPQKAESTIPKVKVLLLGGEGSGKSTIFKQMRLSHNVPFSVDEMEAYRRLVFENITRGFKDLLDAMEDTDLGVQEKNRPFVDLVKNSREILRDGELFPANMLDPLRNLWTDPNVQKAWERRNQPENLLYFSSDLDRLFYPSYTPTDKDILHCYASTTGITERTFEFYGYQTLMVDVGGRKSERSKWIECFQDVRCILFMVSLSGYDEYLTEDKDTNRMQDAMTVWESICDSPEFANAALILFLNKKDLFERKILHSDIKGHFSDFDGGSGDVEAGHDYFRKKFVRLARKEGQQRRIVYVHTTNATDLEILKRFKAMLQDTMIRSYLERTPPPRLQAR